MYVEVLDNHGIIGTEEVTSEENYNSHGVFEVYSHEKVDPARFDRLETWSVDVNYHAKSMPR